MFLASATNNMKTKESFRDISSFLHSTSTKPLLIYTDKSASTSPLGSPAFRPHLYNYHSRLPRKAHRIAIYCLTSLFALAIYFTWHTHGVNGVLRRVPPPSFSTVQGVPTGIKGQDEEQKTETHLEESELEVIVQKDVPLPPSHSPWVLGPPTLKFRDNLRPHLQYITSWLAAGWSTSSYPLFSCTQQL